ncbi:POTRA domain-containing protein [Lutibacter oricola]|uniref:POTRA domain-containing protein n=1 Tax=Lutibacter oricola TaxID=762486 RepID=UPI000B7CE511|nr:POTRA domain-containing protein [Lutibacter oricola]
MKLKNILHLIILLIYVNNSFSQKKELVVYSNDTLFNTIPYKKFHNTKKSVSNEIKIFTDQLLLNGYINYQQTTIDNDSIIKLNFKLNEKIDSLKIHFETSNLPEFILKKAQNKTHITIPIVKTDEILNQILDYYVSNGYSFTTVNLKNTLINNGLIESNLKINFNKERNINNITIEGYDEFPKKKLLKILQLNNKTTFNKEKLKIINNKLTNLNFATTIKKPQVLFTKDSTELYLYLRKKSSSKIDGLIGFSNEDGKKIKVNGFLNLELNNTFNKNEEIKIKWLSNSNTSTLNLNYFTPYIFGSNFNLGGSFEIIRKDSTYTNTLSQFKLGYNLSRNIEVSSIILFNKSNITNNNNIFNFENFNKKLYGISLSFNNHKQTHITNTNSPNIKSNFLTGNNEISNTKSSQLKYNFYISYLFSINSKNFIFLKSQNEYLNSKSPIENDRFRIGGFNTIRGFNEESILTYKYSTNTIEHHYLTTSFNYLYTFIDIAFIQKPESNSFLGLGIGYNIKNKNSIFNIGYALGKSKHSQLKLQNSKLLLKISYLF